ncbi:NB-ARC domain-containing protein [Nocardia xishanensis]|uniref:NB-ARC domain-containing protein n=1 Tax=Nocardia xishanensis TaxID=238964 RepID=A0ABW7X672_9NOCA
MAETVQGVVQGNNNTVTLVFDDGRPTVPYLAPPMAENSLVGRDGDFATLRGRLLSGENLPISAVNGLPGVGKTAIAIALAHDPVVLGRFSDGVLWHGLGREPDLRAALAAWSSALGLTQQAGEQVALTSRAAQIRDAIGLRRMLIVIDDAWHIEDALTLRIGGPNCAHLLTTRIPEVALRFGDGELCTLSELSDTDSREMLRRLAPIAVATEPAAVSDLIRLSGGLPLALSLIGRQLRVAEHTRQPRRIRTAVRRLSQDHGDLLRLTAPIGILNRHPGLGEGTPLSLQSIIQLSVDALTEPARCLLGDLGVFPPKPVSIGEDAVIAVGGTTEAELDELTDSGLLEPVGPGRYTLHQTISDYARAALTPHPEVNIRMINYFVEYVESHRDDFEDLERELPVILEAFRAASEQRENDLVKRGVLALFDFLDARGLYTLAGEQLERVLPTFDQLGPDDVRLVYYLGRVHDKRGDLAESNRYLTQAMRLARPSSQLSIDIRIGLGWVTAMQGRIPEAIDHFEQAKITAGQIGSVRSEALALHGLGWSLGVSGRLATSLATLDRGVEVARSVGEPAVAADLLQVRGWMQVTAEDVGAAEESFRECLALARAEGRADRMIDGLQGLAVVARRRCRYGESIEFCREAIVLAERTGHRERMSLAANLGHALRDAGQTDEAERQFRYGLELARRFGHEEKMSRCLGALADIEIDAERPEAAEHLEQAENIARKGAMSEPLLDALEYRARMYRLAGRFPEALASLQEGRERAAREPGGIHAALMELEFGEVFLSTGDVTGARTAFEQARRIAEQRERRDLLGLALFGLARAGTGEQGRRFGEEAQMILGEIGHRRAASVAEWLTAR